MRCPELLPNSGGVQSFLVFSKENLEGTFPCAPTQLHLTLLYSFSSRRKNLVAGPISLLSGISNLLSDVEVSGMFLSCCGKLTEAKWSQVEWR